MADVLNGGPARPVTDQSTSELVQRASEQITTLVRDEIALAKAELTEKGKHAGIGVGLFGGGGVLAFYGLGALLTTIIIALDLMMPLWLAALIVTVVWLVIAAVLASAGKKALQASTPPAPQTVETVKEDIEWAKTRTGSAQR